MTDEKPFNPLDHVLPETRVFTECMIDTLDKMVNDPEFGAEFLQKKIEKELKEAGLDCRVVEFSIQKREAMVFFNMGDLKFKGVFTLLEE
jgi:hypothetical protein